MRSVGESVEISREETFRTLANSGSITQTHAYVRKSASEARCLHARAAESHSLHKAGSAAQVGASERGGRCGSPLVVGCARSQS